MRNILIFLCFFCCSVYSQTSESWFLKGELAYNEEDYESALSYYKNAANLGSTHACAVISYIYYCGIADGGRNTDLALQWAKRAGVNKYIESDAVLAMVSYYNGDFENTRKILEYWNLNDLYTESKLALAISYMVSSNNLFSFAMRDKAELLVKSIYDKTKIDDEKPDYYYASCAILAKIEYEKERDIQNGKMWAYLEKFGTPGKDDFVYCPLAECLFGFLLTRFADEKLKSMGEIRLEVATKFDYNKRFKILYPFAPEIKAYYDKAK